MTTDRHLALMALMRAIEEPAKTYQRSVRLAASLATDSAHRDAAVAKGAAALDDIDTAVRDWTTAHPAPEILAEVDRLRGVMESATEFQLTPAPPAYTPLIVRRDPAYDGTRWAVLHDPGDLAVRRVWTPESYRGRTTAPAAAVEAHVVADGSDNPEHIDDCPGCAAAPVVSVTGEETA